MSISTNLSELDINSKVESTLVAGKAAQAVAEADGKPIIKKDASNNGLVSLATKLAGENISSDIMEAGSKATEIGSLSAGALNADLLPATDVSIYRSFSLQILGTWSGTLSIQGSNDGTNFINAAAYSVGATNSTTMSPTTTGNGIQVGPINFKYLRVRMTAYSSGTATGVMQLYSIPYQSLVYNTAACVFSSPTGGALPIHLLSAANNNATVVKASSGNLYGVSISNTNAAFRYVKFYNKSTTPAPATDNASLARVIGCPPNSRVHESYPVGIAFTTGISFATVTGSSDTDNTSVGAGDLVIGLEYK